jgi:hypothetical protein
MILDTFTAQKKIDGDISFVPLNLDMYEYQLTYTIKLVLISQIYKGDLVQSVRICLRRRKKNLYFFL